MEGLTAFFAYSRANQNRLLAVGAAWIVLIAALDWKVEPNVSLGILYLFPILLMAGFLTRPEAVALGSVCAILREAFGSFGPDSPAGPRVILVSIAFVGSALFVGELSRNTQLMAEHLDRMRESDEQMRVLIETSPAAILTAGSDGKILLANQAAHQLLGSDQSLESQPVARYLPVFERILEQKLENQRRGTRVECRGQRRNGEVFLAHAWFSVYRTTAGPKLAAIVADASEDLRDRERLGLRSTVTAFRVLSGVVSHEVRNLSGAAAVVHTRLGRLPGLAASEDYKALGTLVEGLEKIASDKLQPPPDDSAGVILSAVLDDLRILLEPSLGEAGMVWEIPARLPRVRGDHHALLQVFLNLTNNSLRAMGGREEKRLTLSAAVEGDRVVVRCWDTGPGVPAPESLFQPFQSHADGAGLGLYISHAMISAFGGELRYEPQPSGSCFAVDLASADGGRQA